MAVILSLLASTYLRHPQLRHDENYYYPLGEKILHGTFDDGYVVRPPLYPLLLAGIFTIFGAGFGPALAVQSILRGLLVAGVACLGRKYLWSKAGLVSALLLAVYPPLVSTYSRFMSEVLYTPLFLLSFYLFDKAAHTERPRDMAVAGLAGGLASLTRSTSYFLTFLFAAWLVIRKSKKGRFSRGSLVNGVVLVALLLATTLPWAVRNAVAHGGFMPVGNVSAFNLWLVTSGEKIKDANQQWQSWGTQAERASQALKQWITYLKGDPLFHIRRLGRVVPQLLDSRWDSPVAGLSVSKKGYLFKEQPGLRQVLEILHPVTFYIILAGGLAGVLVLERDLVRRNLVLITFIYFVLVHGASLSRARFLLPLEVLLSLYAGGLVARGLSTRGWTRRCPR